MHNKICTLCLIHIFITGVQRLNLNNNIYCINIIMLIADQSLPTPSVSVRIANNIPKYYILY